MNSINYLKYVIFLEAYYMHNDIQTREWGKHFYPEAHFWEDDRHIISFFRYLIDD